MIRQLYTADGILIDDAIKFKFQEIERLMASSMTLVRRLFQDETAIRDDFLFSATQSSYVLDDQFWQNNFSFAYETINADKLSYNAIFTHVQGIFDRSGDIQALRHYMTTPNEIFENRSPQYLIQKCIDELNQLRTDIRRIQGQRQSRLLRLTRINLFLQITRLKDIFSQCREALQLPNTLDEVDGVGSDDRTDDDEASVVDRLSVKSTQALTPSASGATLRLSFVNSLASFSSSSVRDLHAVSTATLHGADSSRYSLLGSELEEEEVAGANSRLATIVVPELQLPGQPLASTELDEHIPPLRWSNIISRVEGNLYIGGYQAARDRERLQRLGITHILNCVGDSSICPNMFSDQFTYHNLNLLDSNDQQLIPFLPEALGFINRAQMKGGRVYVHCEKGRSRSAAVVIAYLMGKYHWLYVYTLSYLQQFKRAIVDPNLGFSYQLDDWGRTKRQKFIYSFTLFHVVQQDEGAEKSSLTLDVVLASGQSTLESRECYVLQYLDVFFYIWVGREAPDALVLLVTELQSQVSHLASRSEVILIQEGEEPEKFLLILNAEDQTKTTVATQAEPVRRPSVDPQGQTVLITQPSFWERCFSGCFPSRSANVVSKMERGQSEQSAGVENGSHH